MHSVMQPAMYMIILYIYGAIKIMLYYIYNYMYMCVYGAIFIRCYMHILLCIRVYTHVLHRHTFA